MRRLLRSLLLLPAVWLLVSCEAESGSDAAGTVRGRGGRIPFDVVFESSEPLGLRLDATLHVLGFSRQSNGKPALAESSGMIKVTDTLVAVNGKDVSSLGLQRAVLEIRDAELPKVRDAAACVDVPAGAVPPSRTRLACLMSALRRWPPSCQRCCAVRHCVVVAAVAVP
jgi:hypothetical protein